MECVRNVPGDQLKVGTDNLFTAAMTETLQTREENVFQGQKQNLNNSNNKQRVWRSLM